MSSRPRRSTKRPANVIESEEARKNATTRRTRPRAGHASPARASGSANRPSRKDRGSGSNGAANGGAGRAKSLDRGAKKSPGASKTPKRAGKGRRASTARSPDADLLRRVRLGLRTRRASVDTPASPAVDSPGASTDRDSAATPAASSPSPSPGRASPARPVADAEKQSQVAVPVPRGRSGRRTSERPRRAASADSGKSQAQKARIEADAATAAAVAAQLALEAPSIAQSRPKRTVRAPATLQVGPPPSPPKGRSKRQRANSAAGSTVTDASDARPGGGRVHTPKRQRGGASPRRGKRRGASAPVLTSVVGAATSSPVPASSRRKNASSSASVASSVAPVAVAPILGADPAAAMAANVVAQATPSPGHSNAESKRRNGPPHTVARGCEMCGKDTDQDKLLCCDTADCKGEYHVHCLTPPITRIPPGAWFCPQCLMQGRRRPQFDVVGCRVWTAFTAEDKSRQWMAGRVVKYNMEKGQHCVAYDSGTTRWVFLEELEYQLGVAVKWAKLHRFPWWPALKIEFGRKCPEFRKQQLTGKRLYRFFGDDSLGWLPPSMSHGWLAKVAKNRYTYRKNIIALAEAEMKAVAAARERECKRLSDAENDTRKITGKEWVGRRVMVWNAEANYPSGAMCNAWVARYSKHNRKHLIVFESKKFRPKWAPIRSLRPSLATTQGSSQSVWSKQLLAPPSPDGAPAASGGAGYGTGAGAGAGANAGAGGASGEANAESSASADAAADKQDADAATGAGGAGSNGSNGTDVDADGDAAMGGATSASGTQVPCRYCKRVGKPSEHLVECTICHRGYHAACMEPGVEPKAPREGSALQSWACLDCKHCHACKTMTAPANGWHDREHPGDKKRVYTFCDKCNARYKRGEYCPICVRSYGEDEVNMLFCDACEMWVHCECDGVSPSQLALIEEEKHPLWSSAYYCSQCTPKRMLKVFQHLIQADKRYMFYWPVTEDVAPGYFTVIKQPMDLHTIYQRLQVRLAGGTAAANTTAPATPNAKAAGKGKGKGKADATVPSLDHVQFRQMFEQICANALTFNSPQDKYWKEAFRFLKSGSQAFEEFLPMTSRGEAIDAVLRHHAKLGRLDYDTMVLEQPKPKPPPKEYTLQRRAKTAADIPKSMPLLAVAMPLPEAAKLAWTDLCGCCGSGGDTSAMLLCMDCGEAYHTYCVNARIPADPSAADRFRCTWRCPNCKICEVCGDCKEEQAAQLLMCEICDAGYHMFCLKPKLKKVPDGRWVCWSCIHCRECSRKQVPGMWSTDDKRCRVCAKAEEERMAIVRAQEKQRRAAADAARKRAADEQARREQEAAQRCPVCRESWSDADTDMVGCDKCDNWVHFKCDGRIDVKALAAGKDVAYTCPVCLGEVAPLPGTTSADASKARRGGDSLDAGLVQHHVRRVLRRIHQSHSRRQIIVQLRSIVALARQRMVGFAQVAGVVNLACVEAGGNATVADIQPHFSLRTMQAIPGLHIANFATHRIFGSLPLNVPEDVVEAGVTNVIQWLLVRAERFIRQQLYDNWSSLAASQLSGPALWAAAKGAAAFLYLCSGSHYSDPSPSTGKLSLNDHRVLAHIPPDLAPTIHALLSNREPFVPMPVPPIFSFSHSPDTPLPALQPPECGVITAVSAATGGTLLHTTPATPRAAQSPAAGAGAVMALASRPTVKTEAGPPPAPRDGDGDVVMAPSTPAAAGTQGTSTTTPVTADAVSLLLFAAGAGAPADGATPAAATPASASPSARPSPSESSPSGAAVPSPSPSPLPSPAASAAAPATDAAMGTTTTSIAAGEAASTAPPASALLHRSASTEAAVVLSTTLAHAGEAQASVGVGAGADAGAGAGAGTAVTGSVTSTAVVASEGRPPPRTPLHGWGPGAASSSFEHRQERSVYHTLHGSPPFSEHRACCLCGLPEGESLGRLLAAPMDARSVVAADWVHAVCAFWSSEVFLSPRGVLVNVVRARSRGARTKCAHCKLPGATMGCCIRSCRSVYHVPCAVKAQCWFLPNNNTYCENHLAQAMQRVRNQRGRSKKSKPSGSSSKAAAADPPALGDGRATPTIGDDASRRQPSPSPSPTSVHRAATPALSVASGVSAATQQAAVLLTTAASGAASGADAVFRAAAKYPCVSLQRCMMVMALEPLVLSEHLSHSSEVAPDTVQDAPGREDLTDQAHCVSTLVRRIAGTAADLPLSELPSAYPCLRIGALTVLRWGEVVVQAAWHTEHLAFPVGFMSRRIFWSVANPWRRCVYTCEIVSDATPYELPDDDDDEDMVAAVQSGEQVLTAESRPLFVITCDEDPSLVITAPTPDEAVRKLREMVAAAPLPVDKAKLPFVATRVGFDNPGLRGADFFGVGLPEVKRILETLPCAAATSIVPLDSNWPQYQFQYHTPSDIAMTRIRRRRERDRSRIGLKSLTGCARSEGILPGGRRSAAVEAEGNATAAKPSALAARVASRDDSAASAGGSARSGASLSSLYRTLNSKPLEERVRVRRSEIHGWGLYVMSDVPKHTMVIEYCGEVIGQAVADKREKRYEANGMGSCYLFRLDKQHIVDATYTGCAARFINHCCEPNSYSRIVTIDGAKHIIIFAMRDLAKGEEVTYDYKFPLEDEGIPCRCGAANCRGRMN